MICATCGADNDAGRTFEKVGAGLWLRLLDEPETSGEPTSRARSATSQQAVPADRG